MAFLLLLLVYCGFVFALIAVHEAGHYLAGVAAGIPASAMRIRLLSFPQHVSVRDRDGIWLSPVRDIERYIAATAQYIPTRCRAFLWVSGGLLLESAFITAVCVANLTLGYPRLAFWAAALPLAMYAINLVLMDLPQALLRRRPCGDTSGLWVISPPGAIAHDLLDAGLRGGLVYLTFRAGG